MTLNLTNYNKKRQYLHTASGGCKGGSAPLAEKFLDFGSRIERFGVVKRSITRFLS